MTLKRKRMTIEMTNQSGVHCTFIHGLLNNFPAGKKGGVEEYTSKNIGTLSKPLRDYWGNDIIEWTQEGEHPCDTYTFTYLDTMNRAYTDKYNNEQVCKALQMENGERKVYAHSMGNLLVYNAIRTTCPEIDKNMTQINNLNAPFGGVPLINKLEMACRMMPMLATNDKGQIKMILSLAMGSNAGSMTSNLDKYAEMVPKLLPIYCTKDGRVKPGPKSCSISQVRKDTALLETVRNYSYAAMCGATADGDSRYKLFNSIVGEKYNDGLVPLKSCADPYREEFLHHPEKFPAGQIPKFWINKLNHSAQVNTAENRELRDWLITVNQFGY